MRASTEGARVDNIDGSLRFLAGDGEMACLMREKDWSQTILGPPDAWPQALRVAVRLLLTSGHPMYIWWGLDGACLYNDAYRQSIGPERHPSSLGKPAREIWAEIWDVIGPQVERVMAGRGATWNENALVPITRHGRREDVYWTYSYSPIDDDAAPNGVGGVLVVCTETTKTVLAAQALASEQKRVLQLLKMMPGFVAVLRGPEHVYEYVNDAYVTISGHRQFIGRTIRDVFPELVGQPFFGLLDRVRATGQRFVERAMPVRLAGEDYERFLDLLCEPIRDDSGNVSGILVGGYDVTEARRVEAALAAREEQLRLAVEAAEVGLWDVDEVNNVLYWPARVKAMFGISPHAPVSMTDFYAGLHPDDRERVAAAYTAAADFSRRALYDVEYRTVGKESKVLRWVAAKGRGVFDADGRCLRVIGTAVDITARKRGEIKLAFLADLQFELGRLVDSDEMVRMAADRLANHLALSHCVVVDVESGAARVAVLYDRHAPGLRDLAGIYTLDQFHTAEERADLASGRPVVIADVDAPEQDPDIATAFKAIGVHSLATVPYLADGEWRFALSAQHRTPHDWEADEIELLRDVAESLYPRLAHAKGAQQLRISEAALRQADRRKDVFLATLSHELRNPLAPIRHAARILAVPELSATQLQHAQSVIQRQVAHMAGLLDDLLNVARVTSGKLQLKRDTVSLTSIIDTAVETARPMIDAKQHQLSIRMPAEAVPVDGDPVRLAQVVSNLLTNAAKYTDVGGHIELAAVAEATGLCITVRDDGIGIPPVAVPDLFMLFAQVEETRHRSEGGLGIGLALVKGLVELHGGTVEANSGGLGQGSTFVVRLPYGLQPARAAPLAPANPSARGRRVLVADDNCDAADTLAMLLELSGHDVRVAYSGQAALSVAAAFRPEIALLDIGMPELTGYEVATALRREPWGREIYLVALTGWGQEEDKARAVYAGFDRHLTKPIDPDALGLLTSEASLHRVLNDAPNERTAL